MSRRLILLWQSPRHAEPEESREWAESQVATLAGMPGVERAELSRLGPASAEFTSPYGWMLELDLSGSCPPEALLRAPAAEELVSELRGLGLTPAVLAAAAPDEADPDRA